MSGTLLKTGMRNPSGPEIILSSEVESVLIQHDLDREVVDFALKQWWHDRLARFEYSFVDGRATTEGEIASKISSKGEILEFPHVDPNHEAHVTLIFSCAAHGGVGATFYVRGEMGVFLKHLRPTIHVDTIEYRYHIPTTCCMYLSNPTDLEIASAKQFVSSVGDYMDSLIADGPHEETGSWFQWLRFRTNAQITDERANDSRLTAQSAIKEAFTGPSTSLHQDNPGFVAHLLTAVGDNNAIVQLHNLLLVRVKNENGSADILIKSLSDGELAKIVSTKDLLKQPAELFSILHDTSTSGFVKREAALFYSYSHKDKDLRDKLESHLSMLKRDRHIRQWHDRMIAAGTEWKCQIDSRLNTADIILLLISADFLKSDYCYDVELQRAMERHAANNCRVMPVILRACDWRNAPFAKLQALPTDGKPITSWSNIDEAFTDVAMGIRTAIKLLGKMPVEQKSDIPPEDLSILEPI